MDKLKIKKNGEFIQIPLSAFANDTNFIDNATDNLLNYYLKNETYTKQEVNELISQIQSTSFLVVDELPETGESNVIYLLLRENPNPNNIYDEYVYINEIWELIGSTEIDLTNYVKNTDYANSTNAGIVKIYQNGGVTIDGQHNIYIYKASDEDIAAKTNNYKPLVSSSIDKAVKAGITNNSISLTDAEKENVKNWIGAGNVNDTDYATNDKGGVIKINNAYFAQLTTNGILFSSDRTYSQYENAPRNVFISKGTLENVITGKNLVSDSNYIHTDNNYTNADKEKIGYIDDTGDGDMFLSNDGSYYSVSNGDIRIPTITMNTKTKDGIKYIRLNFGAYSKAFENYVKENGIQIHLFRYKRNGKRTWDEVSRSQQKRWIHPANEIMPLNEPARQCWGIGSYKYQIGEDEYENQLNNAEYFIPNDGVVQSEFTLTYAEFSKGFMEIPFDDIMRCVVKCEGYVGVDDTDMRLPSLTGYSTEAVKIIGGQQSRRRSRMHQPIKYCFALPIRVKGGKIKYQYGECTNTGIIELMTRRDADAMLGYLNGTKSFIENVGYGIMIK